MKRNIIIVILSFFYTFLIYGQVNNNFCGYWSTIKDSQEEKESFIFITQIETQFLIVLVDFGKPINNTFEIGYANNNIITFKDKNGLDSQISLEGRELILISGLNLQESFTTAYKRVDEEDIIRIQKKRNYTNQAK